MVRPLQVSPPKGRLVRLIPCNQTSINLAIGRTYFSLDDEVVRGAAEADPLGFVDDLPVRTSYDEVQRVPELVKGSIAKPGISGLPEGLQVAFPV
jgi:hypothetical protein